MLRSNFSKLWRLTKALQKFEDYLFKKHGWRSLRTVSLWGFELPCSSLPLPRSPVPFKSAALQPWELYNPEVKQLLEGLERVWCFSKSPIPRELSLFNLPDSSLEKSLLQGLSVFDLTQRSLNGKSFFLPGQGHLLTITGNSLTAQVPKVVKPVEANKRLTNKFKGKSGK